MAAKTLAYDFDLFDNSINRKSATAPAIPAPVRPHAVPQKPRTRSQLKAEARYSRRQAVKIAFISFLLLVLLGSSVYCRAVVMELEAEKAAITTTIKEAESENVRLRSAVDSIYSIDNISSYAEEKLGMIKKDGYQINYFEVD